MLISLTFFNSPPAVTPKMHALSLWEMPLFHDIPISEVIHATQRRLVVDGSQVSTNIATQFKAPPIADPELCWI
jgi:hypothetical protein